MQPTDHGLKRELKLHDLVLMQILVIMALNFAGYAAKQGRTQVVLWLLAVVLFYLPQAAIVITLSRAIPIEGGVYQWVKRGISPFAGYMAGWSFFVYIICGYASFGTQVASGIAYVGGSYGAWISTSKVFALSLTALISLLVFVPNARTALDQVDQWRRIATLDRRVSGDGLPAGETLVKSENASRRRVFVSMARFFAGCSERLH
jgi:amino acid transporter